MNDNDPIIVTEHLQKRFGELSSRYAFSMLRTIDSW